MKLNIRQATESDCKKANEFLTKLIRDEKKYDENINEKCVVYSLYENLVKNSQNCILVAEVENKIIGYLFGYIKDNGDAYINKVARLEAMFIEEDYRQRGIGNDLIAAFKKWAIKQKVSYIELSVCNNNNQAISIYKKNGFKDTKTIMELDLR